MSAVSRPDFQFPLKKTMLFTRTGARLVSALILGLFDFESGFAAERARDGGLSSIELSIPNTSPGGFATLLDAVTQGLTMHPRVLSALAEVERARSEVNVAEGGYQPSIEVSAGPESRNNGEIGYNVTVSQMIYDWGRVGSSVDAANASLRQQNENLALVQEEAALEIVEIHLDVLSARQRLQAIEAHQERLRTLRQLSAERESQGYADGTEASRAALSLARAAEQLAIERGRLRDATTQYHTLVGQEPTTFDTPIDPALPRLLTDRARLDEVIRSAPAYRKAQEDVAVAEAQIHGTKASLVPQLRLEGSSTRRQIAGRMIDDSTIALRLRVDPWQGISGFDKIDAARRRLDAVRWTLDNVNRELRRKLSSMTETAEVTRWRVEALEAQRAEAAEVRSLYEEQFMAAMRDIADLLLVENDALEVERQIVNARTELLRIHYRMAAEVGLLRPALEQRLAQVIERP